MIIRDEEVFFVDYLKDSKYKLAYAPLRSFIALVRGELETYLIENDNEVSDSFFERLRKYPLIDPVELHNVAVDVLPMLSLPITDNCNLKCKYCYFSAGDEGKVATQSRDSLKAYIDSYLENIVMYPIKSKQNTLDISISGGGEPTSEFETMKYAVLYLEERCKELGYIPKFNMPTNGAYGDKIREFIAEHFDQISFSMDGPQFIQDLHRPFKNGAPSFPLVFETAKYFYDHNFSFAFRATVSDYSVSYLREILDFFHGNFPGKIIGLEPLNLFGRAVKDTELAPPDNGIYSEKLLDAYEYASKKGIRIKTAAAGKFEQLRTVFCGAVGIPNWTITTDGRITSCTRDNLPSVFSFGSFDRDKGQIQIDKARVAELRKLNVLNYDDCQDCFCKYNCAGDCPDLRLSNMLNCDATKRIATYILNERIDLMQL